jgi:hypothetical protein
MLLELKSARGCHDGIAGAAQWPADANIVRMPICIRANMKHAFGIL